MYQQCPSHSKCPIQKSWPSCHSESSTGRWHQYASSPIRKQENTSTLIQLVKFTSSLQSPPASLSYHLLSNCLLKLSLGRTASVVCQEQFWTLLLSTLFLEWFFRHQNINIMFFREKLQFLTWPWILMNPCNNNVLDCCSSAQSLSYSFRLL